MSKDQKHALWLEKDGNRSLFAADDIEAALINGYSKIDYVRANGEPWNPEPVEGEEYQNDLIADGQKRINEAQAKKDEKKRAEAEKANKASKEAAEKQAKEVENATKVKLV